jgi:hypothetical protein
MGVLVRGIAIQAMEPTACRAVNDTCPLRFRRRSLAKGKVPVYLRDDERTISTSFEAVLQPYHGILGMSITRPDGDQEGDWVAECIKEGFCGVSMSVEPDEHYYRQLPSLSGAYIEILSYKPRALYLSVLSWAKQCLAWVETDGAIDYKLPEEMVTTIFDYYEISQIQPEPNINGGGVLNYGRWEDQLDDDRGNVVDMVEEREVRQRERDLDNGPIEGRNIALRYRPATGEVEMVIGAPGDKLAGLIHLDRKRIFELQERVNDLCTELAPGGEFANDDDGGEAA